MVPLDTSRHCGRKRSMLTGRRAGGGVRAEVIWGGASLTAVGWLAWCSKPHPQPVLPAWLTCSAWGPEHLMQPGVRLAEGAEVGSGQHRLAARKASERPASPGPAWGQPGTHRVCGRDTALQPSRLPLHPFPGGKRVVVRPGRQAAGALASGQGGPAWSPTPMATALSWAPRGTRARVDVPVAGSAQHPQPEEQGEASWDPEGRRDRGHRQPHPVWPGGRRWVLGAH